MVWESVPAADVNETVFWVTVIEPEAETEPQPPTKVTVKGNVPAAVGVPLIVTTLFDQAPVTPVGNPVKLAPLAPVVE